MCGIAGVVSSHTAGPVDRSIIETMNAVQFHRGPDEGGMHYKDGVGLAHRRLSIIDLKSGQQPLYNEDGSVVVVYNGEIYNFHEIAERLRAAGHRFRTNSDTEVIVHAWEEWGVACVHRFRGMFSFALWDANRDELFLARDRVGIKPLYYAELPGGRLAFASELKGLLVLDELSREIDHSAVEDYFAFGYVPDPKTIFRNVAKLPPGHTLLLQRSSWTTRVQKYWDVTFRRQKHGDLEEIVQELQHKLREAVGIRMIAEVPLGAFLSGGVDSSAVVAMMAGQSPSAVKTCSISFGEAAYNESEYALAVAQKYATDHRTEQVAADDFSLLEELSSIYDEPFADASAIPTYRVCELARKDVTVALSGDGGDENFGGYRRHRWHMHEEAVRSRVPQALRGPLFGTLGRYYPKLDWAPKLLRAKTTFQALARDSIDAYLHSVSVVSDDLRRQLFNASFERTLDGYRAQEVFKTHARNAPAEDALALIQYLDFKTYLPGDILTKVDRASMIHSLEVRVPILDHEFVEWVAGLESQLKLKGRQGKYVFKKAMQPYLPNEILYRPKMGFGVPLSPWFRGPLRNKVRERVLGSTLRDSELFNMPFLEKVIDEHQSGIKEHSAVIWSLLMFESFYRNAVTGSPKWRVEESLEPAAMRG